MRKAELVINYTMTSDRCLQNWILRDEGTNMDGSIFTPFNRTRLNEYKDEGGVKGGVL